MTAVEVQGRDAAREAYRICTAVDGRPVRALVPECLIEGLRPGTRPTHQEAYEWIATHRAKLAAAVADRVRGRAPRAPFDLLTLIDIPPPSSCR